MMASSVDGKQGGTVEVHDDNTIEELVIDNNDHIKTKVSYHVGQNKSQNWGVM